MAMFLPIHWSGSDACFYLFLGASISHFWRLASWQTATLLLQLVYAVSISLARARYIFFELVTSNYEVITAEYSFRKRSMLGEEDGPVMSEEDFVAEWKESIKSACLGRKKCDLDREFQLETAKMMKNSSDDLVARILASPGIDMLRYGAWGYDA